MLREWVLQGARPFHLCRADMRLCHDCPRRCVHRRRPQRPAKAGARASPLGPDCLGMPRRAHGLGPRKGRRTHRPELLLRGPPLDKRGPLERRRPPPLAVWPLPGLVSARGAARKEGSTPRSDERARPSAGQGGPAAREEREGLEGRCPPLVRARRDAADGQRGRPDLRPSAAHGQHGGAPPPEPGVELHRSSGAQASGAAALDDSRWGAERVDGVWSREERLALLELLAL
mmetsp:Transcript_17964/g.56121  ORF Transcript_17964/g.56121 Transcript_17964/m.56121 type:complete len:231 (-) Transcript_17964:199-891(-)